MEYKELEKENIKLKKELLRREKLLDAAAKANNCLVRGGYGPETILKAMGILGIAADADRVSIFENIKDPSSDKMLTSQRYEWAKDGISAQIDNPELQNMPTDVLFPGWFDKMARGEAVNEIVKNLLPSMKEILEPQGIFSILIVPVIIEGFFWGTIGFDDCKRERLWEDWEIDVLGALAGTIGVAVRRKQLEEEKEKIEIQLRQSQKMEAIGTLAGGIAHDFNNILAAIIGYTEMSIIKLPHDNPVREHLTHIIKGGNRAKELINQILTFSRKNKEEHRAVDISIIIKEALKFLKAMLPSSITIKQSINSKNALVLADPTQIYQLLLNLSSNASYAIGEKSGEIQVELDEIEIEEVLYPGMEKGSYVKITVRDNGCGIDKKYIDRIFEPFFTTKKQGEGTGMGLSMVHGIVKSLNGHVTLESEIGKGTSFYIFLPRIEAKETEIVEHLSPLRRGNEKILFVDDEEDLVQLNHMMLKNLGYKVTTTCDSKTAIKKFEEKPDKFDLVITDYAMPFMTGLDMAEEISRINPSVPIIMCTGFGDLINKEKTEKIGIKEILLKPVSYRKMAETIRSVLDEKI